jgi:glycosyltransferase involved in cell wall biosynthesis
MKIVMLSQSYPPVIGGLERHVKDLAEGLVKRGHEVSVITHWQNGYENLAEHEILNGVELYRIRGTIHRIGEMLFVDTRHTYAPPFPDPEMLLAIRRILQEKQPDVVHAHNWLVHSYLPLSLWSKTKLVVTLHDYGMECAKWTFVRKGEICSGAAFGKCADCLRDHYGPVKGTVTFLSHRVMSPLELRAVDMFLPVSQAIAKGNKLEGFPHQVVPNFIPDENPLRETDAPNVAQLPEGDFMLFVGAYSTHKGFDILLEAYRGLETTMPLVFIGYETQDFPLSALDIPPNVHFFKNWSNSAVMEAWRRSTIAIIPSNWGEPCPTVVMEAMMANSPVISTNAGGIPDIVADGETGILVPTGDVLALRAAMKDLLENPAKRQAMAAAGKERVVRFQAKTVIPQIEGIYQQLITENHKV